MFENAATNMLEDSPRPEEMFWSDEGTQTPVLSSDQKLSVAEDLMSRRKAATTYDPSTVQKKSFSDVVSPFYGGKLSQEVDKARQYIDSTLSEPVTVGPLRGIDFSKFKDPKRITEKIPIYTAKNPDSSAPARANYSRSEDRIVMGEDFKYGTGKPHTIKMNGKDFTLPASSSFLDVLNHEMGHSMFPASMGLYEDKSGSDYYDAPTEMATELAHAQRQRYRDTGSRFTEKSFIDFMDKARKDKKHLDVFSPSTKDALNNLLDGTEEAIDTRVKQAAKVIPALVNRGSTSRTIS
jgi:hypothetical protein